MVVCNLNDLGLPTGPHIRLNFADKEVTAVVDRVVFEVWKYVWRYGSSSFAYFGDTS